MATGEKIKNEDLGDPAQLIKIPTTYPTLNRNEEKKIIF